MEEQQEREQVEAERRRAEMRERRAGGAGGDELGALRSRRLLIALGGGGSSVTRLTADGSSGEVDWALGGEIAWLIPLTDRGIAFGIGLSYTNLPVSGCSAAQTRGSVGALQLAPRIPISLGKRAWLNIRAGAHLGVAATWPGETVRDECARARLGSEDSGIAYGARLKDGDAQARVSLSDLGWRGYGLAVGPDAEVGVLFGAGPSDVYVGVAGFLRHDQIFAFVSANDYRFRDELASSVTIHSTEVSGLDGRASMARFQFGARGVVLF